MHKQSSEELGGYLSNKRIGFVDENRNVQMEGIDKLDDIYKYKKQLLEAANRYV